MPVKQNLSVLYFSTVCLSPWQFSVDLKRQWTILKFLSFVNWMFRFRVTHFSKKRQTRFHTWNKWSIFLTTCLHIWKPTASEFLDALTDILDIISYQWKQYGQLWVHVLKYMLYFCQDLSTFLKNRVCNTLRLEKFYSHGIFNLFCLEVVDDWIFRRKIRIRTTITKLETVSNLSSSNALWYAFLSEWAGDVKNHPSRMTRKPLMSCSRLTSRLLLSITV